MATNKPMGDNARKGAVRDRVQVYNPKIKRWIKINKETNLFMDQMAQKKKPFKGIKKI